MMREMSKLEGETETKLSMKELAQRFENLAHGETRNTLTLTITDESKSEEMVTGHSISHP